MSKNEQLEIKEVAEVKGEKTMEKKQFNYFEYVKFLALKEYYKAKLNREETKELSYVVRFNDSMKNSFFRKNKAFVITKTETEFTEEGKQVTRVFFKDLDIDAKAISKAGKEFNIFSAKDRAKAFSSAEKSL